MTDANQISSQQSTSPSGRDEWVKKMLESAEKAVEILHLGDFIRDNKEAIYRQLEDCDVRVSERPSGLDPNAAFVAQSLPLIGGGIHFGRRRAHFDKAAIWVLNQSPHAETNSLLSTLVLLYIVDQGWQDAHGPNQDAHAPNDEKKKAQWESIYQRAKWLCEK